MYKGRFAPSPTGPLHFGSMLAAFISYMEAKTSQGEWHVRIDDVDHQRCKTEHVDSILRTLELYGLNWDGKLVYQSNCDELYNSVLFELIEKHAAYACSCSRKALVDGIYPGTCRNKNLDKENHHSIRLNVKQAKITFTDQFQGSVNQNLDTDVGDFVIYRADGIFAYHLATVINDAEAKFTHVIRGIDLLDSTPRQIYLQQLLNYPHINYGHFPVAVNEENLKLSKQTHAKSVLESNPAEIFFNILKILQQSPPAELLNADCESILDWSMENWKPEKLTGQKRLAAQEFN